MHIGLSRPPTPPHPTPDIDGALVAKIAEELGFESIFYGEHPVTPIGGPGQGPHAAGVPFFQDTLVALARASAVTNRIKLGSGVFLLPLHQPVLLAKQIASLDFYSKGRLIVGAGFGWSRGQCEACGGNFDRRFAQAYETLRIMKKLWTEEVTEFHGEFFDVPPIALFPKPVTKPWPPVLLPGPAYNSEEPWDSPRFLHLYKRIVTYADGWIPGFVGNERMREGPTRLVAGRKVMDQLCKEAGRDPRELQTTALLRTNIVDGDLAWPELVSRDVLKRYADIGTDRIIITIPTIISDTHAREVLERMAEALL